MATMRVRKQRIEPRWIGLWLIGVLCGALLVLGISGLTQRSYAPQPAAVNLAAPAVAATSAALVPPAVDEMRAYRSQRANAVPQATSADASANDLPRLDETTYYQTQRLSAPPAFDQTRSPHPQ